MNSKNNWFSVTVLLLTLTVTAAAQVSQFVTSVKVPQATEGKALSVSVELAQQELIKNAVLKFRQFGETEFRDLEILVTGRTGMAQIPEKVVAPPYIEYYVKFFLTDGTEATYPTEFPETNPLKINVIPVNPKDLEVRIMSPEEGEVVAVEDLAVAISLFYASDNINRLGTKLFLDGAEVTADAILTDDAILYSPRNFDKPLDLGSHTLRVQLFDRQGKPYHLVQSTFSLSTAYAIEEQKSALQLAGNGQLELRNEKIDTLNTQYVRGDFQTNGSWKFLNFGANLHLTNEDKPDRQPQNRYTATLDASDIFRLQLGDAYPTLPSLVVSGKRVRGVTSSLTLGFFNLDVSVGQTERKIEGLLNDTLTYKSSSDADSRPKESFYLGAGDSGKVLYRRFTPGTFNRNLIAVRPSFGSGENFQWGISYMKVKDDAASIVYGTYPKENLVAGTDFTVAFDDQHFRWYTQMALSISNNDISKGNFSDEDFAGFGKDKADSAKIVNDLINTAKLARSFITVNDEIFPANPADASMPSVALETELTLNYLNNYIRALGFRRGKAYQSFGNEFIQTDIQGFNISDRVRMWQNRIMVSASYEYKANNLANDPTVKTTKYGTLNTSATIYPGVNLPSFVLGYGLLSRTNGIVLDTALAIKPTRTDSATVADEGTNRYYIGSNYDFSLMNVRHSASVSVSIAKKTDNTYLKRDQDNSNIAMSLTTTYKIPLQTSVGMVFSSNKSYLASLSTITNKYDSLTTIEFSYSTISLSAQYRMLNDKLTLSGNIAPSFGDFERMLLMVGADYRLNDHHTLTGQLDFINNPNSSDLIASIVWRFNF